MTTRSSWENMKKRCLNPNAPDFERYGKVEIDPRRLSFDNFLVDMGEKPEGLTIERKDGTKGYNKDNCKWRTKRILLAGQDRLCIRLL